MVKSKRTPSAEEKIIQGLKGVADALESGEDLEGSGILASRGSVKFRRRRCVVGLALAAMVVMILIAALAYYHEATSLGDPLFSNIDESDIVAAKMHSGKHTTRYKKPTMVDVPPRFAFEVLTALMPNRPDPRPADWAGWLTLEFKLKSGKEYFVSLFQTYDKEAAFRMGRGYYRGGSEAKLRILMRKADKLIEDENEPR
ncbi:MAG: hypothetical protein U9N87_13495, partial [Planctomycetota bacterium]|nr:hypothetical protein [Planctomycetota bacterium]